MKIGTVPVLDCKHVCKLQLKVHKVEIEFLQ
jgi:hypothetical protein